MAESGFSRPALPQLISMIRSDLLTRFGEDAVLRRLDTEIYARVQAAAVHTLYGYLDYLARNMLPDLADEDWLLRHGNLKKVKRKSPTAASGFFRWEGVTRAITIPAGTTIQRTDGREYLSTSDAAVNAGVIRVPVTAAEAGSDGNCDDKEAGTLISPIDGLSSTGYAESITGGADEEDLEVWRSRIMDRWYYVPQSGADPDYVDWAKQVQGITRAWTIRSYSGVGTVGVMVATSDLDNPVPAASLVAGVREYILPRAPVAGSGLFVFAASAHVINLTIALAKDSAAIRQAVTNEIKSMFLRDGAPGGKIYLSRISEAISMASGEVAHSLQSPASDVQLGAYELPMLGAITWADYLNSTG
ncbi:baseplate J/gp47 family protein [Pantoea sp. YU22]|uniref:baseplate J/gp47 family protein n=1 Tax=Pantoea sp. YU22 TaxID=2497684 RepID=UPI000F8718F9|nr:baseplate J/gp47 family protein [Pantoea sp. YU22]RTY53633.1 baseplate J/gp47 family protein [Pantoea sp. YU22]